MKKIIILFIAITLFSCNDGDFDVPEDVSSPFSASTKIEESEFISCFASESKCKGTEVDET